MKNTFYLCLFILPFQILLGEKIYKSNYKVYIYFYFLFFVIFKHTNEMKKSLSIYVQNNKQG